jgi:hypothetical protein
MPDGVSLEDKATAPSKLRLSALYLPYTVNDIQVPFFIIFIVSTKHRHNTTLPPNVTPLCQVPNQDID